MVRSVGQVAARVATTVAFAARAGFYFVFEISVYFVLSLTVLNNGDSVVEQRQIFVFSAAASIPDTKRPYRVAAFCFCNNRHPGPQTRNDPIEEQLRAQILKTGVWGWGGTLEKMRPPMAPSNPSNSSDVAGTGCTGSGPTRLNCSLSAFSAAPSARCHASRAS